MRAIRGWSGRWCAATLLLLLAGAVPAAAQMRTVDPNAAMAAPSAGPAPGAPAAPMTDAGAPPYQDSPDLAPPGGSERAPDPGFAPGYGPGPAGDADRGGYAQPPAPPPPPPPLPPGATRPRTQTGQRLADAAADDPTATYQRDDLLSAAEGTFGKGAEGLARIIERILKDQGRPNAYIGGREIGGAFIAGLRYGSGTLHSKLEGERPIYWTGPSVGFDFGGDGAKSFVLVYNLYDTQELYHRFPQAEGGLYFIGGFTASYLRWKDVVLIPIRLGVGLRYGVNLGYMKFSERPKLVPF